MGAKFREKRKLPPEINFVDLNFVPKAFVINYSYKLATPFRGC